MKNGLLLSILTFAIVTVVKSQDFRKLTPTMIDIDSGVVWLQYDSAISRENVLKMQQYLFPNLKERIRRNSYFAIPQSNTYLVSVEGQQLIQLEVTQSGVKELAHSSVVEWSWTLDPVFFIGDSSVFLIGEYGEENYQGFLAIDILDGILHELADCAFTPADPLTGYYASASDFVRVRRDSTYILSFDTDIVLNPMHMNEQIIRHKKGTPISFRLKNQSFVRER